MTDLLTRLETATGDTQHVVIYDALVYAHKQEWISDGVYDRAMALRNAGAYLDAALTLVPEGCGWQLESHGASSIHRLQKKPGQIGYPIIGEAGLTKSIATPALALCIACLGARDG